MEKKFDLISSMMKRLGVSPRVFVLQCMKGNQLSLNCSVSDETSTIMLKPSNCDVQSHDDEEDIVVEPEETTGGHSDVIPPEVKPTFEDVFYKEIGLDDFDEFELNENTQDKVKCGMFVYANGTKFVIRKKPMSLKLMQTNSLEFKGIMFANQDDSFLVIRFGDERCGYKRAVRKLIKNGIKMVVLSLGADGAIVADEKQVLRVYAPETDCKSTVGAGDSMVAAAAYGIVNNLELETIAKMAVCAGSLTAQVTGLCDGKDILNGYTKIKAEIVG